MKTRVEPNYVYAATLKRVIDGDTCDLVIDLGFHVKRDVRVRLLGINTPEMEGATRQQGIVAKIAAELWFDRHTNLIISTSKIPKKQEDNFGRYLAIIRGDDSKGVQTSLNQFLISEKLASPYMTEGMEKDPYGPE